MVIFKVVGITSKRQKLVQWTMSRKMAEEVETAFRNNGMQTDIFEHNVPTHKKGEFLEWLNLHAV